MFPVWTRRWAGWPQTVGVTLTQEPRSAAPTPPVRNARGLRLGFVLAGILAVMGASPAWAAEAEPSLRAGTADAASTSEPAAPFPREATECATHARNAMTLEERVGQLFLLGIGR